MEINWDNEDLLLDELKKKHIKKFVSQLESIGIKDAEEFKLVGENLPDIPNLTANSISFQGSLKDVIITVFNNNDVQFYGKNAVRYYNMLCGIAKKEPIFSAADEEFIKGTDNSGFVDGPFSSQREVEDFTTDFSDDFFIPPSNLKNKHKTVVEKKEAVDNGEFGKRLVKTKANNGTQNRRPFSFLTGRRSKASSSEYEALQFKEETGLDLDEEFGYGVDDKRDDFDIDEEFDNISAPERSGATSGPFSSKNVSAPKTNRGGSGRKPFSFLTERRSKPSYPSRYEASQFKEETGLDLDEEFGYGVDDKRDDFDIDEEFDNISAPERRGTSRGSLSGKKFIAPKPSRTQPDRLCSFVSTKDTSQSHSLGRFETEILGDEEDDIDKEFCSFGIEPGEKTSDHLTPCRFSTLTLEMEEEYKEILESYKKFRGNNASSSLEDNLLLSDLELVDLVSGLDINNIYDVNGHCNYKHDGLYISPINQDDMNSGSSRNYDVVKDGKFLRCQVSTDDDNSRGYKFYVGEKDGNDELIYSSSTNDITRFNGNQFMSEHGVRSGNILPYCMFFMDYITDSQSHDIEKCSSSIEISDCDVSSKLRDYDGRTISFYNSFMREGVLRYVEIDSIINGKNSTDMEREKPVTK